MTKKDKPYYGPAGIFSTDDPAADQRQIEAESFDETEWEQEDPEGWEETYEDELCVCGVPWQYCICNDRREIFACPTPEDPDKPWWEWVDYKVGEEERVLAEMQQKHDAHCGCGYTVTMPVEPEEEEESFEDQVRHDELRLNQNLLP